MEKEKDYTDEASALAGKMFKAVPPRANSNALILALQSMLGAIIGRTAIDVENKELYSSIADDIYKTAVFVRSKRGVFV